LNSSSETDSTRWSIILQASHENPNLAHQALEALCKIYWQPVYHFIHRRVSQEVEAQDLTQDFFAQLIQAKLIATADRERGSFRAYLFTCVRNFLCKYWEHARAIKRGGTHCHLTLEFADQVENSELQLENDVDIVYERQWAQALTAHVLVRLTEEWHSAKKHVVFQHLREFLTCQPTASKITHVAEQLNTTAGALRVAIHRLRRRYGELLREEVARTVADPNEVEQEIRLLMSVLSRM
jgi:RNA polymerase sigma factor (sigma-70 family)